MRESEIAHGIAQFQMVQSLRSRLVTSFTQQTNASDHPGNRRPRLGLARRGMWGNLVQLSRYRPIFAFKVQTISAWRGSFFP